MRLAKDNDRKLQHTMNENTPEATRKVALLQKIWQQKGHRNGQLICLPEREIYKIHTGSASSGLPRRSANASIKCLLISIDATASITCRVLMVESHKESNSKHFPKNASNLSL